MKDWPQKDMLKVDPKMLRNKAFLAFADMDEPPPSKVVQQASADLRKRVKRISQFLGKLGSTPQREPLLSERMLRASEEELTSLEDRLLKANAKSK